MVVPVDEVLTVAGFHVPGMPFRDVPGRGGGVAFWQSGPIGVKVGVTAEDMVMSMVTTVAQAPVMGVKV